MNAAQRAYNILRGYVVKEWERIQDIERDLAENELGEAMRNPLKVAPASSRQPDDTEVYERAADPKAVARRMLGVPPDATFETIRKTFERLSLRSDPKNFPSGSSEQRQAGQILKRVHWAYATLTDEIDNTQKRFRSLEIE